MLKRPACGNSKPSGRPASEIREQRQPDDQRERYPQDRRLLPGSLLPLARPDIEDNGANDPGQQRDQHGAKAGLENRLRQKQAAIVEIEAAANDNAVANIRQRLEHCVVPEQQLQQQRQVADDFDIAGGNFRHQPVARQPRYADDKADDGRKDDADAGHQQRIEQPDPEGAPVSGAARGIFDQRLADIEAGGVFPEPEAGCDVRARKIFDRVAGGAIDQKADGRAERELIDNAADLGVVVKNDLRRIRRGRKLTRHFPLVGPAARRRPPGGVPRVSRPAASVLSCS